MSFSVSPESNLEREQSTAPEHPEIVEQPITIRTKTGSQVVPGWCLGELAVIQNEEFDTSLTEGNYSITHRPTGLGVSTWLLTRDEAVELMTDLSDLDWNWSDPNQIPVETKVESRRRAVAFGKRQGILSDASADGEAAAINVGLQSPYILAAVPCKYIDEPNGSTTFKGCYTGTTIPPPSAGNDSFEVTLGMIVCCGEAPGEYLLTTEHRSPDGARTRVPALPITFRRPYQQFALNLPLPISRMAGQHFFDLRIDGRLVARVPLEVEFQEPREILRKMIPYPGRKRAK